MTSGRSLGFCGTAAPSPRGRASYKSCALAISWEARPQGEALAFRRATAPSPRGAPPTRAVRSPFRGRPALGAKLWLLAGLQLHRRGARLLQELCARHFVGGPRSGRSFGYWPGYSSIAAGRASYNSCALAISWEARPRGEAWAFRRATAPSPRGRASYKSCALAISWEARPRGKFWPWPGLVMHG